MTRTNIEIDDELIAAVMRQFQLPTKKSAVEFALRRTLEADITLALFEATAGLGWDGDLEAMRGADAVEEW